MKSAIQNLKYFDVRAPMTSREGQPCWEPGTGF